MIIKEDIYSEKKLIILYGDGCTGKTTLMNIIKNIFTSSAYHLPIKCAEYDNLTSNEAMDMFYTESWPVGRKLMFVACNKLPKYPPNFSGSNVYPVYFDKKIDPTTFTNDTAKANKLASLLLTAMWQWYQLHPTNAGLYTVYYYGMVGDNSSIYLNDPQYEYVPDPEPKSEPKSEPEPVPETVPVTVPPVTMPPVTVPPVTNTCAMGYDKWVSPWKTSVTEPFLTFNKAETNIANDDNVDDKMDDNMDSNETNENTISVMLDIATISPPDEIIFEPASEFSHNPSYYSRTELKLMGNVIIKGVKMSCIDKLCENYSHALHRIAQFEYIGSDRVTIKYIKKLGKGPKPSTYDWYYRILFRRSDGRVTYKRGWLSEISMDPIAICLRENNWKDLDLSHVISGDVKYMEIYAAALLHKLVAIQRASLPLLPSEIINIQFNMNKLLCDLKLKSSLLSVSC
jgi:hypothetical protein